MISSSADINIKQSKKIMENLESISVWLFDAEEHVEHCTFEWADLREIVQKAVVLIIK